MEKDMLEQVDSDESSKKLGGFNIKNIKPFLGVFAVFLILSIIYFFIWKNITLKMRDIIADSLNNFKYESISISGFPFNKSVVIKNINFYNNNPLITNNYASVETLKISSFIFGNKFYIDFKNPKVVSNEISYNIVYNKDPETSISFYPNGSLSSFNYSDSGYRVINENNETLYTTDETFIDIESVKTGNTVDYSIVGELKNMQNIDVLKKKEENETKEPDIYNASFNVSTSMTKENNKVVDSIIKILSVNLISNTDVNLGLTGEILNNQDDPYSFGEITLSIGNYKTWLKNYKKDFMDTLNVVKETENIVSEADIKLVEKIFTTIEKLINKNPQTKDTTGYLTIKREKKSPTYFINDKSLLDIIMEL